MNVSDKQLTKQGGVGEGGTLMFCRSFLFALYFMPNINQCHLFVFFISEIH